VVETAFINAFAVAVESEDMCCVLRLNPESQCRSGWIPALPLISGNRRCRGHARRPAIGLMASAVAARCSSRPTQIGKKVGDADPPSPGAQPCGHLARDWPCFIETSFHFPQAEEMKKLRRDETIILFPTPSVHCMAFSLFFLFC
jgi:hypothetical protein